jgi:hypothetical protein
MDFGENILDYILNAQIDRARESYLSYSRMLGAQEGNIESFYDLVVRCKKEEITPELEEAIQKMAKEIETYVPETENKKEHKEEGSEIDYNEAFNKNFEELKTISDKLKKQVK